MKKLSIIICSFILGGITSFAQSNKELQDIVKTKNAQIGDLQDQIAVLESEVAVIEKEINIASGWTRGLNGLIGFSLNNSNSWINNPNPDARSVALNLGLSAYLNNEKEKSFLNNKLIIQKAWQDVDLTASERGLEEDGLFNNGTVDLLNISSLYGYKINDKLAISGLGEFNSSLGNFLEPATLDAGLGVTWTPLSNFTLSLLPINIHGIWWSGRSKGAFDEAMMTFDNPNFLFGAKLRLDYNLAFNVAGKDASWNNTITGFMPYSSKKFQSPEFDDNGFTGNFNEVNALEYTWISMLNLEIWKGIGLGFGWGLRSNKLETSELQTYTTFGLSYSF